MEPTYIKEKDLPVGAKVQLFDDTEITFKGMTDDGLYSIWEQEDGTTENASFIGFEKDQKDEGYYLPIFEDPEDPIDMEGLLGE